MKPISAEEILKEIYKAFEEDILFDNFGTTSAKIIEQKNKKFGISVQTIINKYLCAVVMSKIRAEIEKEESKQ